MTTSTDDMIRSSIVDLADQPGGSVDRAREDVLRRIVRRRRRRRSLLGATIVAIGVGAVLLVPRDASQLVATDAVAGTAGSDTPVPEAEDLVDSTPSIAWQWVEATVGPDGTERVVLVFDKDLPEAPVRFVDDVASPEPSAVSYTTQAASGGGPGGEGIRKCGARHWFPNGTTGSVDLLLPSEWFAPGPEAYRFQGPMRIEPAGAMIGKISACQYQGFIQFSVWAAASDNPADVTVSVEGNTLTLDIESSA